MVAPSQYTLLNNAINQIDLYTFYYTFYIDIYNLGQLLYVEYLRDAYSRSKVSINERF